MDEQTIQVKIPRDVAVFCDLFEIAPQALLEQYLKDLCSMQGNGGSDERRMAKEYFLRTYLSRQTDFTMNRAEEIAEDFEMIYQNAYPCVGNKEWEKQREELLTEVHQAWLNEKKATKTSAL